MMPPYSCDFFSSGFLQILEETHHYWRQMMGLEEMSQNPGAFWLWKVKWIVSRDRYFVEDLNVQIVTFCYAP